jgi:hypothetical protein
MVLNGSQRPAGARDVYTPCSYLFSNRVDRVVTIGFPFEKRSFLPETGTFT